MKRIAYCIIENCTTRVHGHGLCLKHYLRQRNHGNPLKTKHNRGEGTTHAEKFWSRVLLTADVDRCWLWIGCKNATGYGVIAANKEKFLAHHYAWFLTYGYRSQQDLLHSCDNPACVNPRHLREGDQSDNNFDMMVRGRSRGYCLTEMDVRMILHKLQTGQNAFQIHKETGIHYHSIRNIRDGKHWSLKLLNNGGVSSPQP